MTYLRAMVAALLIPTTSCAANRAAGTRPEDMTATEHLEKARESSLRASAGYRVAARRTGPYGVTNVATHWYPWYSYWDAGAEYAALADAHRAAAEELQVRYDSACALAPRGSESLSSLDYVTHVDPLERGIVVQLAPQAGAPDAVLAALRCHRAWLMLEPHAGNVDEPLLVPSLVLVAHAIPTGTLVMLTVTDDRQVGELRRRVAARYGRDAIRAR